jgi:CRISPR/Cas system-associated protein Csm6
MKQERIYVNASCLLKPEKSEFGLSCSLNMNLNLVYIMEVQNEVVVIEIFNHQTCARVFIPAGLKKHAAQPGFPTGA